MSLPVSKVEGSQGLVHEQGHHVGLNPSNILRNPDFKEYNNHNNSLSFEKCSQNQATD